MDPNNSLQNHYLSLQTDDFKVEKREKFSRCEVLNAKRNNHFRVVQLQTRNAKIDKKISRPAFFWLLKRAGFFRVFEAWTSRFIIFLFKYKMYCFLHSYDEKLDIRNLWINLYNYTKTNIFSIRKVRHL